MKGFCVGEEERAAKRKDIKKAIRQAMPFDKQVHKCVPAYERELMSEVFKGMSTTGIVGSSLLKYVHSTLTKEGVERCGQIPPAFADEADEDDNAEDNEEIEEITPVLRTS